jgi:hypothetical protein
MSALDPASLEALLEEATIEAYGEDEQITDGWYRSLRYRLPCRLAYAWP